MFFGKKRKEIQGADRQRQHLRENLNCFSISPDICLSEVYCIFASPYDDLVSEAGELFAAYFNALSEAQILAFRERFRERTSMEWSYSWKTVDGERLKARLSPDTLFAVAAAGSFHPNGYYRETCLKLLAEFGPISARYFILALNDWVEPVRRFAMSELERLMPLASWKDLLLASSNFRKLEESGRRQEEAVRRIRDLLLARLSSFKGNWELGPVMELSPKGRRSFYRLALMGDFLSSSQLLILSNMEKDCACRDCLLRSLLQTHAVSPALLNFLTLNKNASVRYLALEHLYKTAPERWKEFEAYLADSTHRVRSLARFVLKSHGETDFTSMYSHILDLKATPGALIGYGEVAGWSGAERLTPFLADPCPSMRRAALMGLGHSYGEDGGEFFLPYLVGKDDGLSSTAYQLLGRWNLTAIISPSEVARLYSQAKNRVQQKRLWNLTQHIRGWSGVIAVLLLIPSLEDGEREDAWRRAWYSNTPWLPWQEKQLISSYSTALPFLPKQVKNELEFTLHILKQK